MHVAESVVGRPLLDACVPFFLSVVSQLSRVRVYCSMPHLHSQNGYRENLSKSVVSGIFSPKVAALENPHHMVVFQKFWMGKEATVSFIKLIVRPMEINENIFSLFWMATPSLL